MATDPAATVNLRKAKDCLADLQATLAPDLQLLNGLQEEIGKTLAAGATVKQIWISLRQAGFKGNQTKLSDWLQEKGLRKKMVKKGSGKRRKKAERLAASQQAESQSVQPAQTGSKQEKTEALAAEKPAVKENSSFEIDDDNY